MTQGASMTGRTLMPLSVLLLTLTGKDAVKACTVSAESQTREFAEAQAQQLLPKNAQNPAFQCREKDVGSSSRWRCIARWSD